MPQQRLDYLLAAYKRGEVSRQELEEFFNAVIEPENAGKVSIFLDEALQSQSGEDTEETKAVDWNRMLDRIIQPATKKSTSLPAVPLFRSNLFKYAAAAVAVLALSLYLWPKPEVENSLLPVVVGHTDVQPGGNKATLTLSDGTKILLDDAAEGKLARQGSSEVVKLSDGQLRYSSLTDPETNSKSQIIFNTMSTPRGGQYRLTLPDGSHVWLNAESSITYPVAFVGDERRVSVTGEAYFQIAKDRTRPFRVNVSDQSQIEVLGTEFNVNAYADGGSIKTSLLEGSIRIDGKNLLPGQACKDGDIVKTDLEQDVAWKNGIFNFHQLGLKDVMKQLSRWYDISVEYEGEIPKTQFFGEMGRDLTLAQVLKGLEGSGVKFRLEHGKTIIVKP